MTAAANKNVNTRTDNLLLIGIHMNANERRREEKT